MDILDSGTLTILGTLIGASVVATIAYRRLCRQVQDLWTWHNKEDDEGVKIWYVRKSLEEAITKLAENTAKQTEILQEIHREQVDQRRMLRDLTK